MKSRISFPYLYGWITTGYALMAAVFLGLQEGYGKGRSLMMASLLYAFGIFFFISRRLRLSVLLAITLGLLIYFVSALKYRYLGASLSVPDVRFYFRSISGLISLSFSYGYFWPACMLLLAFLVLLKFALSEPVALSLKSVRSRLWFFVFAGFWVVSGPHMIRAYGTHLYQGHVPPSVMSYAPCLSGFVLSERFDEVQIPGEPSGGSLFRNRMGDKKIEGRPSSVRPDIFVWLEESTFDPSLIRSVSLPDDLRGLVSAKGGGQFSSLMRVHVFGGETWNSEFSFFTGLNHKIFGPAGSAAPVTIAPKINHALPLYLKTLGYRTVALYPVDKNYLNADRAYARYGFDQVLDSRDFGEAQNWAVKDDVLAAFLRSRLSKEDHSSPLFVMMLTMYQHGPHTDSPEKPLSRFFDFQRLPGVPDRVSRATGVYLDRMRQSARVVKDFSDYLRTSSRKRDYVFVHFGDHQPNLGQAGLQDLYYSDFAISHGDPNYLTYFKVDSNLKLDLAVYPTIDIAFLGNYVLKSAGLPLDDFYSANEVLLHGCEGRYLDCGQQELFQSYLSYIFHDLKILE